MELLNLFSIATSFIGSIFLSLGLIKSKQQIEDETGTYFGHNPYLKEYVLSDQKFILLGFHLLIISFAFQFAMAIPWFPEVSKLLDTILLGIVLSLSGVLSLLVYQRYVYRHHETKRQNLHKKHLYHQLEFIKKNFLQNTANTQWLDIQLNALRDYKGAITKDLWQKLAEEIIVPIAAKRISSDDIANTITSFIEKNLTET
ncbi:MAG: hypothetical protein WCW27_01275 [Patescibacteria group bacterium]|jgi:hypothetical protein